MSASTRRAAGLFAKPVVAGAVKTRLAPPLTPEGAARLYAAFLADTATMLAGGDWDWSVFSTDPHAQRATWPADAPAPPRVLPQVGADLGERMRRALEEMLGAAGGDDAGAVAPADTAGPPADAALLVGSDHPTLPRRLIAEAFSRLNGVDLVLGPSHDGGYYLIGLTRPAPELFTGIAWSTAEVFAATRAKADALGLRTAVLEAWNDVDTPEDLVALVAALRGEGHHGDPAHCPATRRALRELGYL